MGNNDRFVIEMHVGKLYGVGRMNCDSTGRNKDVMFNNKRYHRISSQSKKYAWRENMEEYFCEDKTYKTRHVCDLIEKRLESCDSELLKNNATDIAKTITEKIILDNNNDTKEKLKENNKTAQVIVITNHDVDDIISAINKNISDEKALKQLLDKNKNIIETLKKEILSKLPMRKYSIECSLFGRMSTVGIMEPVESSVCVNHSYSLGKAKNDTDYFVVNENYVAQNCDDIVVQNQGAGYLDSKDIAPGHVYYEYTSIDVTHFYENLCKGVDMTKEENKERVKKVLKDVVLFMVDAVLSASPKGAQNAFATSPLPVGALIRIRDKGQNLTADNFCFQEMSKYDKTEEEKFYSAMNNFLKFSKSNYRHYLKDIFVTFSDDAVSDYGETMTMLDAINNIGEMIDERF